MDRDEQMREVRRNTPLSLEEIGKSFGLTSGWSAWNACKGIERGANLPKTFIIIVDGKKKTLMRRY